MRPTGSTITVAVIFAGNNEVAAIMVLDPGQIFDDKLSASIVNGWMSGPSSTFDVEV